MSAAGKYDRCVGLTTSVHSCDDLLEILGASNTWTPKSMYRSAEGFILTFKVSDIAYSLDMYIHAQ